MECEGWKVSSVNRAQRHAGFRYKEDRIHSGVRSREPRSLISGKGVYIGDKLIRDQNSCVFHTYVSLC